MASTRNIHGAAAGGSNGIKKWSLIALKHPYNLVFRKTGNQVETRIIKVVPAQSALDMAAVEAGDMTPSPEFLFKIQGPDDSAPLPN